MTFQLDLYRVILIAAVVAILALQVFRAFAAPAEKPTRRPVIIFGCRHRGAQYNDKAGDTFVLGLIAAGMVAALIFALYRNSASEASALTAVLMAIINAIKESRQQRSSERTIQQVAPAQNQGGQG